MLESKRMRGSAGSQSIEIRMLGGFEVRDERGSAVAFPVRKAEGLLALLALHLGRPVARDKVCGLLWPDVRESQARHSLRQTLLCVRKVLPNALHGNSRSLTLDAARVRVDVSELERQLEVGTRPALVEVSRTYRGDLLEGLTIGEQPFEQWLSFERERVRSALARGLTRLIDLHVEAGELAEAIETCSQVLQLDPLRESIHRSLMRLQARQGRRSHALRHYQSLVRMLRENLGTDPDKETQRLHAELERAPEPVSADASSPQLVAAAIRPQLSATVTAEPTLAAKTSAPPVRARTIVAAPNADSPAVARSQELAALHGARAQASSALWLVQGEAGVGKTHLSSQFASEVAAAGGRVLRGRCYESEQVLPFSCWLNLLVDAQVAKDPLLAGLPNESRRELARLLPELGEAAPPRAAEGAFALFRALEMLLALLAQGGELLVILEDLHWADEMSLRTLCFLTRRQARARSCLVLASARSEDIAGAAFLPTALAELEREHMLQRIKLEPFSREHTRELALQWAERLALKTSHASWVERVWALSEGNALVIVESAHALAHALEMDLERLSVPERVRALIRRRIAQCSADARELAALAAVYGRELDPALLQDVLAASQLVAASEELIQAQLMHASGERIAFTHDRIRETLYEEMLPARRRLLHDRIARALELSAGGSELEASALGQVGYHHAKAGNAEAAIPYLVRFSEHARRSHALGEAITALEQALKCALQLPAADRARAVIKVMLRLAFSLAFLGRFQDLLRKLEEHAGMLEGLGEHELVGSYHFWWGLALTLDGQRAQAQQHAELAREHAVASDDRRMRGYAHNLSAHLSTFAGRFEEGVAHAKIALELLLADGGSLGEAVMFAFVNLTTSHLMTGNWRQAQSVAQQAESYAQGAENKRGRAMAALCSGFVHAYTHRWELVLAAAQRSCEASNTPFTLGPAMSLIAMAQLARGEFAPAIALLETMVKRLEKLSMRGWRGVLATLLAEACLRSGDLPRARRLASEAAETAQELGDRLTTGIALLVRGRAAKVLGEIEAAQSDLYAALELCEAAQGSISTAYTLRAIAELELTLRHPKRARAALQRAQDIFSAHSLDIPALDTAARVSGL